MKLYHVTREQVLHSITKQGIRPAMSTGEMQVSWYVDEERVVWALAHVSARWSVSVDHLYVLEVDVPPQQVYRWMGGNVYYARRILNHVFVWGYEKFLKPEALPEL